jgi:transcriptional regulator with XRE-family HTH domain
MGTETSNVVGAGLFHTGDVIRKWRKAQGIGNPALAKLANINKDTITRIENGDPGVGMDIVEAVVTALGKSMRELFAALDASGRLTADEARLLTAYRTASQPVRDWLIQNAELLRDLVPPSPPTD